MERKEEDPIETKGRDDGNRALQQWGYTIDIQVPGDQQSPHYLQCSPGPPELHPNHPEDSLSEKAQMSLMSSSWESHVVTTSHSPAGDGLPPGKPDPDSTVLPDPTPCRSCCWRGQQRRCWVKTIGPALQLTDVQEGDAGQKAFRSPVKELFSTVPPSSRPCKRRIAMPLVLPLPPLLPLPLLWGRGELPPPPKLPFTAVAKNPGTLEKNTECQRNKILEDKTGVMEDCSAAQPAPSSSPPASETADSPTLGTHSSQVPAPPTDLADLKRCTVQNSLPAAAPAGSIPPFKSSPILRIPLNENGSAFHSVRATASPISDLPHLPAPRPPSTHFLTKRIPDTHVCRFSPSFSLTHPSSVAVPSTITATASAGLTSQPILEPGVIDMDTTLPSQAVIFRSPLGSSVRSLPFSQVHCTHIWDPDGQQQRASLPSAPVLTGLPLMTSAVTSAPSPPVSRENHFPSYMMLPSSENTPPSGSTASAHVSTCLPAQSVSRQTAISNLLFDPGITFQPTFGACDGQQPNDSFLVGKLAAPAQAMGPTSPAARPPRGSIMKPGFTGLTLPASLFGTAVNT
ncbi:hypothetical protein HPG69_007684 [Diceros bicornis minor]|uniref:Uncharacterized protein n=1 Tax=Diceros bicornis minor TaxID=77932 RepID=A0A7J7EAR7_DICBM|nr:hypothetical protein HPG69_007684 [Diceros bicornis minor]